MAGLLIFIFRKQGNIGSSTRESELSLILSKSSSMTELKAELKIDKTEKTVLNPHFLPVDQSHDCGLFSPTLVCICNSQ